MGDLIRAEKAERAEVAEKQYRDKGRKGEKGGRGRKGSCFDLPSLILVLQLSNQGGRDKKAEGRKVGRVLFFFFIKIENFPNCW